MGCAAQRCYNAASTNPPPPPPPPSFGMVEFNATQTCALVGTVGAAFIGGIAAGRYLFPSTPKPSDDSEDESDDDSQTSDDESITLQTDPSSWGISSAPYKLCLCINKELKMGHGKVAAQCSHAAVACYKRGMKQYPAAVKAWEWTGCAKIAVKLQGSE